MKHSEETIREACDVLEVHNRTGVPVMRATKGKWLEMTAVRVVIETCRELLEENKALKEQNRILEEELEEWRDSADEDFDELK